jgi:AbrB family looped-hinge helix DNA binding protein
MAGSLLSGHLEDGMPHFLSCGTLEMYMAIAQNEVQVGAQGRIVIPSGLRKALGLRPGDRLVARTVGESLVLERRGTVEKGCR